MLCVIVPDRIIPNDLLPVASSGPSSSREYQIKGIQRRYFYALYVSSLNSLFFGNPAKFLLKEECY